jgi:hypothetical protein
MTDNNIDFLKVIKNYQPFEKTKETTLSEIDKNFGKYFVDCNLDEIPKEHLMLLYPFSTRKPQKYYNEEIYKRTLGVLRKSYQKDSLHTFDSLNYFEESFYYGYGHYTFLCDLINDTNIDGMNRRTKFEFCYLPWYIKTFEGVYFKVIPIILSAILFLKENEKDLTKIDEFSNRDKYNKLNKHGFSDLLSSCNFIVRNSIGHQGFNFEDKMFEENKIRFVDQKESELLWDQEFIDLFEQFLDDCGAIILACLVFRLQHHNEIEGLVNLMNYSTSEVLKRELVKNAVENDLVKLKSIKKGIVNNREVIDIELSFDSYTWEEEWLELFRILDVIQTYYTQEDYNVHIYNLNVEEKLHWLIISNEPVRSFFKGEISHDEFLNKIVEEGRSMLPQFKLFLGRKRAVVRRLLLTLKSQLIPTIKEEYRRRLEISGIPPNPKRSFKILNIDDKSHKLAKRYQASIIIPENLNKEIIKEIIHEATKEVKKKQIYRSDITKKAWKGKDANIVWLDVFTKEKRERDIWFFDDFDYYICHTEWSDKNTEGIVRTFDEAYKDVKICWNKNYSKDL